MVFTVTNVVVWSPFLFQTDGISAVEVVFARIFPLHRRLFEDKVSTFWCVLHNFVKVNNWDTGLQVKMALGLTLISCLPALFFLFKCPTPKQFLLSLFTTSMTFYLFSMQVHEKQISQPLIFFALLIREIKPFFTTFVLVMTFSLYHLCTKDYTEVAYFGLFLIFLVVSLQFEQQFQKLSVQSTTHSNLVDEEKKQKSLGIINRFFAKHPDSAKRSWLIRQALSYSWLINSTWIGFMLMHHLFG